MRDKVKRFISILMTALMFVNLMPVGALADGITSIGYKPEVAASTGNYTVYVYARFDGDPLPGVTLNASQWYTIGYIANVNLPSPGGISWGQYWYYNNNNYCGSTINSTSASGIIGGLVHQYNTSIVINPNEWISANFKACPGADTYKEGTSEPTWHLDIIVDINKNPPVHNLVFKVNNSNGKQIGTPKKVTGKWSNPLSANKYYAGNPVPETIIDGGRIYQLKTKREGNPNLDTKIYFNEPIKNVEFYYKDMGPVVRNYTVNYYLKETTTKVAESITGTAPLGETVTPPTEVTGYTLVPGQETSLTIGDDENVLNLYYTPRTDLSYTVNYYWNGTEYSVKPSKTVTGKMFGEEVTESPIGADGYTPVSTGPKTITIGTGTNEINFYYYKNVTLTANSDEKTYNGNEQTVKPGYTCSEKNVTFDNIAEPSGKGTDAGTYPVNFEQDKTKPGYPLNKVDTTEKYIVTAANPGTLTINKRSVTLTSASDSKVYDGTALTNDTVTVGGADGFAKNEGATYDVTGSRTDVGESDNTFTYTLNEGTNANNYSIELVPGKLEVTPVTAEVIVTITGRTDEMPYDGEEHSVFGYDVTVSNALYNPKEDMQFNGIDADATAKGTDAGTYPIGLTAEDFTNKSKNFSKVTFVVTDGYVKITPRAVTLTSETAGKTYDGTALEKPVVTVGGDGFVEGQVTEIKATGSVTNAGSVANTITFTPNKETFKDGNYAITKTEGTLTIAKRSVLITSQSATKTYDGSALTRPAVTITGDGFVPGELAKAEATGSITKVGSTPNTIQYTTTGAFNAANYSIALSVGTLTVTEKPKPEPRRTFNLTINYVYQNGKRAAASYNRGGLKNGETFDITSPVIAGYTASETVVSGTIYNRDVKVTVIYTADGVNLDDYGVPLGLGNITMNVGDCFE